MEKKFYFSDLKPEAQQRFLRAQNLMCPEDGNYDVDLVPLLVLEQEAEV